MAVTSDLHSDKDLPPGIYSWLLISVRGRANLRVIERLELIKKNAMNSSGIEHTPFRLVA
jgi:hypothetical protein